MLMHRSSTFLQHAWPGGFVRSVCSSETRSTRRRRRWSSAWRCSRRSPRTTTRPSSRSSTCGDATTTSDPSASPRGAELSQHSAMSSCVSDFVHHAELHQEYRSVSSIPCREHPHRQPLLSVCLHPPPVPQRMTSLAGSVTSRRSCWASRRFGFTRTPCLSSGPKVREGC